MIKKAKKALALSLALAPIGGVALSVAPTYAAVEVPYTSTLTDVFQSPDGATASPNKMAVDQIVNKSVGGSVSFLYSIAKFAVDFVFQPTVLAVLASISVIYGFGLYFVRRIRSSGHLR